MKRWTVFAAAMLVCVSVFLPGSARGADSQAGEKNALPPLEQSSIYKTILDYLPGIDKAAEQKTVSGETAVFFLADLGISFLCLWVSILFFTREKRLALRRYLWFLFFFNVSWLGMKIFLKGVWLVLDFFVFRLQPGTIGQVLDAFIPVVFGVVVMLYMWALARTFGMTALGAAGTMLVSHLIYLGVIFAVLSFVLPADNVYFHSAKNYFGVKPLVSGYISDIRTIISSDNVLDYVRILPFHL